MSMLRSVLLASCLLTALALGRMSVPTAPPAPFTGDYLKGDFSGNFTLTEQGIAYTGWMVSELSARRYFHRVNELNMTTFSFSSFTDPVSYEYTIMSSGCTCQVTSGGFVPNLFGPIWATTKSTMSDKPAATCGGDLYVNSVLQGLGGVSYGQYCIENDVPTFVAQGADNSKIYSFSNFVSGLAGNFPVSEMEGWVAQCNAACI